MGEELTLRELQWIARRATETIQEGIAEQGFQSNIIITWLMVKHVLAASEAFRKERV